MKERPKKIEVDLDLNKAIRGMVEDNVNSKDDMLNLQHGGLFYPLFVYGNEQRDFSEHFRLGKSAQFVGVGLTADSTFIMQKDNEWQSPLVFNTTHTSASYRVYGELFIVEPEALFDLDSQHERGIYSRRFRRNIWHCDPKDKNRTWFSTNAFMYTGIIDMFKERIKEGRLPPVNPVTDCYSNMQACRWFLSDDAANRERRRLMAQSSNTIRAEIKALGANQ